MKLAALICFVGLGGALAGCDNAARPMLIPSTVRPLEYKSLPFAGATDRKVLFDPARIALTGITITSTQRQALLSVDGGAPMAFAEGTRLLEDVALVAIDSDSVVIEADGTRRTLTFSKSGPSLSTTTVASGQGLGVLAQGLAPASRPIAAMPMQTGTGSGNAAFLNALEQAGAQALGK